MRAKRALPTALALLLSGTALAAIPALAQSDPADPPTDTEITGGIEQAPGTGVAPPDLEAARQDPGTTEPPDAAIRAGESVTAPDVPTIGPIDEKSIRAMLEAEGFTEVGQIVQDGEVYEARARRDGKDYTVRIDAQTRTILEAQEG